MSSTDSDIQWVVGLLPVVVLLVAGTLFTSWFLWWVFARGFTRFPVLEHFDLWVPLGSFVGGTVTASGLLVTLGYVVRRATH